MNLSLLLFFVLAAVAVLSAIGLLVSRSALYAALFLVLNFGAVAVYYLVLGAPFIAMAQITVYAGAIMVLFLFVIMLLGAETLPPGRALPWQRPLAIGLSIVLIAEAALLLVQRLKITAILAAPGVEVNTVASLVDLGKALFQSYLLPFEVTSVLLLVAMVGVIVLAKREKGEVGS